MGVDNQKPEFLNISVKTISVKTKTVYVADDVKFPGIIEENKVTVMVERPQSISEQENFGGSHTMPDMTYGRSMVENITRQTTVWSDISGNKFGVEDNKGGNFLNVGAFANSIHEFGLDFRGMYLLNASKVEKLIETSRELRSKGIPVEAILKVDRVLEFPLVEKIGNRFKIKEMLTVDQWKKHLFLKNNMKNPLELLFYPSLKNIEEVLNTNDFYVVTRDMPVAERLSTLLRINSNKSFYEIVGKQFNWLNVATEDGKLGVAGDDSLPKIGRKLYINNPDDVNYFFVDYLPKFMGSVTAAVHNAGYHMPFDHIQNRTLVGTPVDSEGYRKIDTFDIDTVKKDVWRWLVLRNNGNPPNSIDEIFNYKGVLNKYISDRSRGIKFVLNYVDAYREVVKDPNLKKVNIPLIIKIYKNML